MNDELEACAYGEKKIPQIARRPAADGQDKWKPLAPVRHFSLCCVQSRQVNREGTGKCV